MYLDEFSSFFSPFFITTQIHNLASLPQTSRLVFPHQPHLLS
nr:MAG TPA: hypothetical protein [Caudoviricetes sp.]